MSENGKHEHRQLQGGEIVYFTKDPGKNWSISSYECRQGVTANGFAFVWLQGLPQGWKDKEFDTVEEAVMFVNQQINEKKVPSNNKS